LREQEGGLGALPIGQFVPAALVTGARMMLRQGNIVKPEQLEKGRNPTLERLEQLDGLRGKLSTRRLGCEHQRCGSWPGSVPFTWRIPVSAAAEWWTTWPEMGSRSSVTECETSCSAGDYVRFP
jgi:hypothetical protein